MAESESLGPFGSKSMPARGAVPPLYGVSVLRWSEEVSLKQLDRPMRVASWPDTAGRRMWGRTSEEAVAHDEISSRDDTHCVAIRLIDVHTNDGSRHEPIDIYAITASPCDQQVRHVYGRAVVNADSVTPLAVVVK